MHTDGKIVGEGLTFDDVLLLPGHSHVLPVEVNVSVELIPGLKLNIPIISAPMDTVTEAGLATALAMEGGLGIIHRNLSIGRQRDEVVQVKRADPGEEYPHAALDSRGRLLVGAAIGSGKDMEERLEALVEAGIDLVIVDTSHGHSQRVIEAVSKVKNKYPRLPLIAGNVATGDGAAALINAGADGLRVGVGPGSICTTRIVAGVGVPQLTAIMECYEASRSRHVPVIADGGIRYSGDVVKALAAGATTVMLGSLLASTEESPGKSIWHEGKLFKAYRGMGSLGAIQSGSDRYGQKYEGVVSKLVPEGIEGMVPCEGTLHDMVYQLVGGLRSGMGYIGAANIAEMWQKGKFMRITSAGLRESHPHDVILSVLPPNYPGVKA
ncbi:MAG: guanosine monophosphate reductase [Chloroflexi bacterium]|nr:guanosine monophosphate reductase [Chloroflexota bacterium]